MSRVIHTANVCTAMPRVFDTLMAHGIVHTSRNGPVIYLPEPLVIDYERPWERVLVNPWRDANPFFHLMEALWMLAGRNDVAFPAMFAKRIASYSDDGKILHGAYGFRWRHAGKSLNTDQLLEIIALLRQYPDTRRAVISMHDTRFDTIYTGKDLPCNTHIYFDTQDGKLNMSVMNRSNDVVWGLLGANYVHFTVLMQFVSDNLHLPMGRYSHFTNNAHVYTDVFPVERWAKISMLIQPRESMLFEGEGKHAFSFDVDGHRPMTEAWQLRQVEVFINHILEGLVPITEIYSMPLLEDVAKPMFNAWHYRKNDPRDNIALGWAMLVNHPQWRQAATEWLQRRWENRATKEKKE